MQAKIRELYKASQESQAAAMMGQGGQPINPYPGKLRLSYNYVAVCKFNENQNYISAYQS